MSERFYIYTEVGSYDPYVVKDENGRWVGRYHTTNAAKKRIAREKAKREQSVSADDCGQNR